MDRWKGYLAHVKKYLVSMAWRSRMVAALLVVIALAGAVWLISGYSSAASMEQVFEKPLPAKSLSAIRAKLDRRQIQ